MGDTPPQIIAACQQGDRDAQAQLYEHCSSRVFGLVHRMVGPNQAADVMQQVFLKAFLTIDQFTGRSRFETWLFRLTVNECLQFLRQTCRKPCESLRHDPVDHGPSHELQVDHRELLDRGLSRLDLELRSIFLLREVEGLTYQEISEVLDIPEGTVASRLSCARAELKAGLVELGWET